MKRAIMIGAMAAAAAGAGLGQGLTPEIRSKVEARARELQGLSTDAAIVSAVKAHNAKPPAEAQGITNERWKQMTLLDPLVRSFSRSPLGQHLKSKQAPDVAECFVSAADGTKVAFLAKTTSWSHAGKEKHTVPMRGKTWIGPAEVDESTGQMQVQVGLPVLDGSKPIGSIVVGLKVSALR